MLFTSRREAVQSQNARKISNESATEADTGNSTDTKNVMFFDQRVDDPGDVVTVFKWASNSERMKKNRECRTI